MSSGGIKQENKEKKRNQEKSKREKGPFWAQKRAVRSVREEKRERERERERERGKGVFRFSLRSTEIEPLVFVEARRKVYPRIADYVWVPKSWSFFKLYEVGNFPTWNIFILKAM